MILDSRLSSSLNMYDYELFRLVKLLLLSASIGVLCMRLDLPFVYIRLEATDSFSNHIAYDSVDLLCAIY
jgi:hypothetical protein